jgi:hypothetical protein
VAEVESDREVGPIEVGRCVPTSPCFRCQPISVRLGQPAPTSEKSVVVVPTAFRGRIRVPSSLFGVRSDKPDGNILKVAVSTATTLYQKLKPIPVLQVK